MKLSSNKKYGLLLKSLVIVAILLVIKLIIGYFNLDTLAAGPITTALVAGVIFTIATVFTGTLTDFKESEKIPGELATSLKAMYNDSKIIHIKNEKLTDDLREHVKQLVTVINSNFRKGAWNLNEIYPAMDEVSNSINVLTDEGVAAPFLVKCRAELTNIDRLANRISIIKETSFAPAAYAIAEFAVAISILVLLFTKVDPVVMGLLLVGAVATLLIGVMLLIKDMDDPFEVDGFAEVDLSLMWRLEEYLKVGS
jgi:hypothetical protein